MTYKLEHKPTSNQSSRASYGYSSKPKGITIHHWGKDGQNHDAVVAWLRGKAGGTSNRNSSAHYVVSGKRVTKLADETRATWHAGHRRGNGETIGIEMRPEMTAEDWETLVQLCADIERRHGSMRYYRHSDWKATACPGRYKNRIGELVKAVNAELAGKRKPAKKSTSKAKTAPKKKSTASSGRVGGEWPANPLLVDGKFQSITKRAYQRLLAPKNVGDYRGRIDAVFGSLSIKAEQRWLKRLGYYKGLIDGIRGPMTIKALQRFLRSKGYYKGLIDGKFQTLSVKGLQRYLNSQRKHYR